jgi:hypothetical protein
MEMDDNQCLADLKWFLKYMAGKADKPKEYAFLLPNEIATKLLRKYKI